MIHPTVLTMKEIDKYEIDFKKLKLIIGIKILGIKIPKEYIFSYKKLILPLPS